MLRTITYIPEMELPEINIGEAMRKYEYFCFLNSNKDENKKSKVEYDLLVAIGSTSSITLDSGKQGLDQLQNYIDKTNGWMFGYLSYDLKNSIEKLSSSKENESAFPLLHFFSPEVVIKKDSTGFSATYDDATTSDKRLTEILGDVFSPAEKNINDQYPSPQISARITKEEYLQSVRSLKEHIKRGDIYEVNFCMEFFAKDTRISPSDVYRKLNALSKAPFSTCFRSAEHYLISSSPERFLRKKENMLISQPIKGTAKRSSDKKEDEELKSQLSNSEKEKAENVMIVDLVRNDLSRLAKRRSVSVQELFGIYSFRQVHQMISTISCELREDLNFTDIIKATFPMGSMTGAPKIRAMELIDQYEKNSRGIYSGAIGYIDPQKNFDFSVVIRSIMYNSIKEYVSFMAGSAITDSSDPEKEYEECLLKAKAMLKVLSGADHEV
jgi:para-aminobenzoate synthetase component 1